MRDIVSVEPIRILSRDRTDQALDNFHRSGHILPTKGEVF